MRTLDASLDDVGRFAPITRQEALHRSALESDVQIARVDDLVEAVGDETSCCHAEKRAAQPSRCARGCGPTTPWCSMVAHGDDTVAGHKPGQKRSEFRPDIAGAAKLTTGVRQPCGWPEGSHQCEAQRLSVSLSGDWQCAR